MVGCIKLLYKVDIEVLNSILNELNNSKLVKLSRLVSPGGKGGFEGNCRCMNSYGQSLKNNAKSKCFEILWW